jgi:8-oxo-dGTP pyrophosphatase MutT (NUDIX family)
MDVGDPQAHTATRAQLLSDADALAEYLRERLAVVAAGPATDSDGDGSSPLAWPGARVAAVLIPLYARGGHPYLLFTRRASSLARHSGEISFPGGSRDAYDASLAATALRESYEELRLPSGGVDILGTLPAVFAAVSNFLVTPVVGWLGEGLAPLAPLAPNPAEVAEVIEVPLAALVDPAIFHEEEWRRAGETHTVYFYDYGAYRIWGLTGRILHTLLELLPAA